MRYPIHEAAALLPLISAAELSGLAEDIKANGLHSPIALHEGKVLDGRNRLAACELAGVEPRFIEWKDSGGGPVSWVISLNVQRRHLTQSQRAVISLDAVPALEKEAKERQGARTDITAQIPEGSGEAREKAASLFGVSARYVQDAKAIAAKAPEMLEAIKAGEITITRAKRELAEQDEFVRFAGVVISRREIDDWRRLRDAERADSGILGRTLEAMILSRIEPSREAFHEALGLPPPVGSPDVDESTANEYLETRQSLERDFPNLWHYLEHGKLPEPA